MSRRGDPRLPTADEIERHGIKDWAYRLVLRLYDRFRDIDSDMNDTALGPLSEVTPAADTIPYFTSGTAATSTGLTSVARSLLDDATVADMRTTLGAQALDAELTALAGLTSAADRLPYFTGSGTAALATFTGAARNLLDDASAAAMLTTLGAQASDAELSALAGLTSAADKLPYFTGSGTAATTDFTAAGRTFVGQASLAAMRTLLVPFKIGSTTRDMTAASGDQTISGVGFTTRFAIFIAGVNGTSGASIGVDDGTNVGSFSDNSQNSAGTYGVNAIQAIRIVTAVATGQTAVVSAIGSDSITLTWTKTGSPPAGTADIIYLLIG